MNKQIRLARGLVIGGVCTLIYSVIGLAAPDYQMPALYLALVIGFTSDYFWGEAK